MRAHFFASTLWLGGKLCTVSAREARPNGQVPYALVRSRPNAQVPRAKSQVRWVCPKNTTTHCVSARRTHVHTHTCDCELASARQTQIHKHAHRTHQMRHTTSLARTRSPSRALVTLPHTASRRHTSGAPRIGHVTRRDHVTHRYNHVDPSRGPVSVTWLGHVMDTPRSAAWTRSGTRGSDPGTAACAAARPIPRAA